MLLSEFRFNNCIVRSLEKIPCSDPVKSAGGSCMATFEFPSDVRAASDLTLQLVLKRMLQDIMQQMIASQ